MKIIKDEQGNSIQMKNLSEALYKDCDGNEYLVGIEGLIQNGVAIYSSYVKYWNKFSKKKISEEKRIEIVSIVIKLFQSQGMRVEIY